MHGQQDIEIRDFHVAQIRYLYFSELEHLLRAGYKKRELLWRRSTQLWRPKSRDAIISIY